MLLLAASVGSPRADRRYIVGWFDKYVEGKSVPLFDGKSPPDRPSS